ncbi:S49 family peptidase [Tropicimonas isoalkanivorans]|uniref:Signal peptide peptidase SppA n=1 Tax=Tropicimonas isoalkanivorans TaxID=441112 RepID=A0A1I1N7R3_9RHOB|nr:S49 family peptidase [Tropicimonas isoalkanivorans]SFC93396.1 signal peptide peptidase SppA [Tropicimonas isoalkanivorans]
MIRFLPFMNRPPLVSVIRLNGMIAAGRRGLNDAGTSTMIERAFSRGKPKAVAVVINSPGGSPSQSSLIASRIRRLAEEKDIPVTAFVEDLAASGGYWLACAADDIIVDENSIVGSIGVISASFGLQDFISRFGVERRVHTAGESKSFLDPFQPEKEDDVARLKALQEQIHQNFIAHVRSRRGTRLDGTVPLFTGDIWVGRQAVDVGLADGVGHVVQVMKERYGKKTRFSVHGPKRGLLSRLGLAAADGISTGLEERALWARYGL